MPGLLPAVVASGTIEELIRALRRAAPLRKEAFVAIALGVLATMLVFAHDSEDGLHADAMARAAAAGASAAMHAIEQARIVPATGSVADFMHQLRLHFPPQPDDARRLAANEAADVTAAATQTAAAGVAGPAHLQWPCYNCGVGPSELTPSQSLKLCAGCCSVSFCSRECQLRRWKTHKEECKEMQARRGRAPKAHV